MGKEYGNVASLAIAGERDKTREHRVKLGAPALGRKSACLFLGISA